MINELLQNKALIFSIISVVVVTILFIIYLILKERKQDQDEIDDIMYSLVDDEDASEDEEIKQEDNEDKKGMDMVVKDEVEKDELVLMEVSFKDGELVVKDVDDEMAVTVTELIQQKMRANINM